jgi:ketosteroid isomerase-like protein
MNAVTAFFQAIEANDLDKIKTYYAADYTFTGPNRKSVNAEERIRGLKAQGGSNIMAHSQVLYRLYGDVGVVTGVATTKTATGASEQSRSIQVWAMQNGKPQLVASRLQELSLHADHSKLSRLVEPFSLFLRL